MSKFPYGFVPIEVQHAVQDVPITHDGANAEQSDLLSGEIECTLTNLSPLLVGNQHYSVCHAQGWVGKADDATKGTLLELGDLLLDHDKTVIEPLFAGSAVDAPIVLPPRSLKGMLRAGLGAFSNAPMERVAEHQFAFRPNLERNWAHGAIKTYPAVVESDDAHALVLRVYDALADIVWVEAEKAVLSVNFEVSIATLSQHLGLALYKSKARIRLGSNQGHDNNANVDGNFRAFVYNDCVRGVGPQPGDATNRPRFSHVLVPCTATSYSLSIPKTGLLWKEFNQTQDWLKSKKKVAPQTISALQLIFVELPSAALAATISPAFVRSFGTHFRYWWRFADSAKQTSRGPDDSDRLFRAEVLPTEAEEALDDDGLPHQFAMPRALFGVVSGAFNDNDSGNSHIGRDDFASWAGRISLSPAIETPTVAERFWHPNSVTVAPILGQPTASAYEHVLRPAANLPAIPILYHGSNAPAPAASYGYFQGENLLRHGVLAGRKGYLHGKPRGSSYAELKAAFTVNIGQLRQIVLAARAIPVPQQDAPQDQKNWQRACRLNEAIPQNVTSFNRFVNWLTDFKHIGKLQALLWREIPAAPIFMPLRALQPHFAPLFEYLLLTLSLGSKQSSLCRNVSAPNQSFTFKIRFSDLRHYELAALLAVLQPKAAHAFATPNVPEPNGGYALKLGYGRPLGWGSVRITEAAVKLWQNDVLVATPNVPTLRSDCAKFAPCKPAIAAWLKLNTFQSAESLDYQRAKVDGQIFTYHTDIRKAVAKARSNDQ